MGIFAQEPLLSTLRPDERRALLEIGRRHRYEAGNALVRQGASDDHVLAIVAGWAVVRAEAANGRSLILGLCGPQDLVGELSALDGRPRSATVSSLTTVDAYLLPGLRFRSFLRDHPTASVEVMRGMALRLRAADDHSQDLATLPILQRLARLLMSLDGEGPRAVLAGKLSQQELATAIGATRESVAKALADLRARSVLSTTGRHVRVLDRKALAVIAEL